MPQAVWCGSVLGWGGGEPVILAGYISHMSVCELSEGVCPPPSCTPGAPCDRLSCPLLDSVHAIGSAVPSAVPSADMTFLGEVHTTVASRGATLLLIGETPRLLANGRDCVQPASYAACATPRTQALRLGWSVHPANHPSNLYSWSLHAAIEQRMQSFTAQRPSTARYVTSAWMFDRLCDAATGMCGPTAPGTTTVVYVDDHHLSTSGSMYLAPFFNCKLRELGLIA